MERALWNRHILVELKFTDEFMGSESSNIRLWRGNPHQLLGVKLERGDTLILKENGKRTHTSIRNLEDWKNLIRTEYGLEDVQALYKFH